MQSPFRRKAPQQTLPSHPDGATLGQLGEDLVSRWLRRRGWREVGRNLKVRQAPHGPHMGRRDMAGLGRVGKPAGPPAGMGRGIAEIDLLMRRRRRYLAVEVKTRRRDPAPERCVTPDQLLRIAIALQALAPGLRPCPAVLQVDVVAVRWPDQRTTPSAGPTAELRRFRGPRWHVGEAIPWS